MKRMIKMLGLSLVAVLAFAAVYAASASASQPEFVLPAEKEFPVQFTSEATFGENEGYLITRDKKHKIECNTTKTEGGEITSKVKVKATAIKFTGCVDAGTGVSCTSAGQAAGTIKSNAIEGQPVYWGAEKNKAGILVFQEGKEEGGGTFAVFKCTFFGVGTEVTVTEQVVGQIGTVNEAVSENTLTFATESINEGKEEVQVPRTAWKKEGCEEKNAFLKSKGKAIFGGPSWETIESAVNGKAPIKTTKEGAAIKVEVKSSKCE